MRSPLTQELVVLESSPVVHGHCLHGPSLLYFPECKIKDEMLIDELSGSSQGDTL